MTDTLTSADVLPADDVSPEPYAPPTRDPRWDALAAPFRADEIEKLPKMLDKNDRDKYQCRAGTKASADGFHCGGYHARSIHLDYVGHAGVTTRLNEVDPTWTWEAMYRDVPHDVLLAAISTGNEAIVQRVIDNAPMKFTEGGLWIRLTILGVTRPGFGDASGKSGPDAVKEVIGDAIRNAGMRFGVATYLWSKSARARAGHVEEDAPVPIGHGARSRGEQQPARPPAAPPATPATSPGGASVTPIQRGTGTPAQGVIGETQDSVARAVAQRRAADAARYGRSPDPTSPAALFVRDVAHAADEDTLRGLFPTAEGIPGGGYRADLRPHLPAEIARVLGLPETGPVTARQLLIVAKKHLDDEAMSIRDHLEAEAQYAAEHPDGATPAPAAR